MSAKRTRQARRAAGLRAEIRRRNAQKPTTPPPAVAVGRVPFTEQQYVASVAATLRAETPIFADIVSRLGIVPLPPCGWETGTMQLPEIVSRELVAA